MASAPGEPAQQVSTGHGGHRVARGTRPRIARPRPHQASIASGGSSNVAAAQRPSLHGGWAGLRRKSEPPHQLIEVAAYRHHQAGKR